RKLDPAIFLASLGFHRCQDVLASVLLPSLKRIASVTSTSVILSPVENRMMRRRKALRESRVPAGTEHPQRSDPGRQRWKDPGQPSALGLWRAQAASRYWTGMSSLATR